jgi:transcriptional regulator
MQEQINQVKELTAKKHVKIWKLHKLGVAVKDIAKELGTNTGNVYNVLKEYNQKPERVQFAETL